jgi:hypothetical protein
LTGAPGSRPWSKTPRPPGTGSAPAARSQSTTLSASPGRSSSGPPTTRDPHRASYSVVSYPSGLPPKSSQLLPRVRPASSSARSLREKRTSISPRPVPSCPSTRGIYATCSRRPGSGSASRRSSNTRKRASSARRRRVRALAGTATIIPTAHPFPIWRQRRGRLPLPLSAGRSARLSARERY